MEGGSMGVFGAYFVLCGGGLVVNQGLFGVSTYCLYVGIIYFYCAMVVYGSLARVCGGSHGRFNVVNYSIVVGITRPWGFYGHVGLTILSVYGGHS